MIPKKRLDFISVPNYNVFVRYRIFMQASIDDAPFAGAEKGVN